MSILQHNEKKHILFYDCHVFLSKNVKCVTETFKKKILSSVVASRMHSFHRASIKGCACARDTFRDSSSPYKAECLLQLQHKKDSVTSFRCGETAVMFEALKTLLPEQQKRNASHHGRLKHFTRSGNTIYGSRVVRVFFTLSLSLSSRAKYTHTQLSTVY